MFSLTLLHILYCIMRNMGTHVNSTSLLEKCFEAKKVKKTNGHFIY